MASTNKRQSAPLLDSFASDGRNSLALILALFSIRAINALSIKTFFQPDEYFQSLEPAWQAAFGNESGAWITWEWHERLRSSIHPLLFAGVYRAAAQIGKLFQVSFTTQSKIMIIGPKLLQAAFAACTDFFTYRLACKVYGPGSRSSRAALALTVLSAWQWFCSVRTLSNSLETTLTVIALDFWPWGWYLLRDGTATQRNGNIRESSRSKKQQEQPRASVVTTIPSEIYISLTAAAIACILRPTNLLVWSTLSVGTFCITRSLGKFLNLAQAAIIAGSLVLSVSIAADRAFYGEWAFPPVRFVYFNVVQSLAVFYGRNRPDYYISEGLYLLLTAATPFAAVALWQSLALRSSRKDSNFVEMRIRFLLAWAITTSVIVLSLIPHKEVRFIYPLLPMLHILAAKPFATFFESFPFPRKNYRFALLVIGIVLNLFIASYASYVHQRGVVDVIHYLRQEYEVKFLQASFTERNMTVGFLMPCHSTPWRSHMIYPGMEAWALTCEPPLRLPAAERGNYLDEADVFYADPMLWMKQNFNSDRTMMGDPTASLEELDIRTSQREWPRYLVFFEQLEPTMHEVLDGSSYRECWRRFNTHWHDDWRRKGDVVVWCRR